MKFVSRNCNISLKENIKRKIFCTLTEVVNFCFHGNFLTYSAYLHFNILGYFNNYKCIFFKKINQAVESFDIRKVIL